MKASDIVAHLRTYCPTFSRNIAAGINWEAIRDSTQLPRLSGFVVPTDEDAGEPQSVNVMIQDVVQRIDVVAVFAQVDEAGYSVADQVTGIRRELCRALMGWTPPGCNEPLQYVGRSFLHTDRAKAAYAFTFAAVETIGHAVLPATAEDAETWQEVELLGLPNFTQIHADVDLIDPIVDKSLAPTGVGPDGRIEHVVTKDV